MEEYLKRLEEASDLRQVIEMIDRIVEGVKSGQTSRDERRRFVRLLLLNEALLQNLENHVALDHLLAGITPEAWTQLFADAVERELPKIIVDIIDQRADIDHRQALRLLPDGNPKVIFSILKGLSSYLDKQKKSARRLRGMRAARIMADLYRMMQTDAKAWRRRSPPTCCIDSERIGKLKEDKQFDQLAEAYEMRINQLQRIDLRRCLADLSESRDTAPRMAAADYERNFRVESPLRLGISSANASDNHLRSKDQGGKTLNIGIDLQMEGEGQTSPPLTVTARRLSEPKLILRSLSMDFKADFEASNKGDDATQSKLFFAYRRGGDEALRLVKQALVHVGIVRDNSENIIEDIAAFTGGGGLELTTSSKVQQGSGLGTSSILAAAVLKMLYRLCGHTYARAESEYPGLYDQSVLLEQSFGLNSGWQDARGACGGPSAIKNFYAPPTEALPAPERHFLSGIDEQIFAERIVLFDTGISRAATRGLNEVLDAYLTRDPARYPSVRESLDIHDRMVAALCQADYALLGQLATRYWQLRCILDPGATNETLQYLFTNPRLVELSEGGLVTGAGGGGFALLIAREGQGAELHKCLNELRKMAPYAQSSVVSYSLNHTGIQLSEQ
jgi:galactokinase/mevalonate kinase-like predicted kinase